MKGGCCSVDKLLDDEEEPWVVTIEEGVAVVVVVSREAVALVVVEVVEGAILDGVFSEVATLELGLLLDLRSSSISPSEDDDDDRFRI